MPNTHETLTSLFSDIADSIRAKTGGSGVLVADNFPTEIDAIPTGTPPLPPDTPYASAWTRPSNYPDLDSLTYPNTANEMYVTIDKTLNTSVTSIRVNSRNGAFYFGHIENGEFVADTGDIQGSSIDISQYSGDILLGKLVVGTSIDITPNEVFAESYINVNNSSVTAAYIFIGEKIKHINIKAYKTAATSMARMFRYCRGLQQLDLSNFDTSLVTNMSDMFDNCFYLKQLDLSNFNTSLVTDMSYMFGDCTRLQQVNLSSFNTSSVKNMQNMFFHCFCLQNLDLSNFDTSSVTRMANMFASCNSLHQVNLSSFNTSSVTNMSMMFYGCCSLQNLDLSNFNTSLVTSMSDMFGCCYSLQNLDLSNFNTSLVTSMSGMFEYCYALQNLDLSSFNTSSVTSMSKMFQHCYSLQNLDLSNFDMSHVTGVYNVFASCYSLKIVEPFQSALTTSQATSLLDGEGLFKLPCMYRSTYLSLCEITPEGTGTINIKVAVNYRLSDADRELLTNKGYTLSITY